MSEANCIGEGTPVLKEDEALARVKLPARRRSVNVKYEHGGRRFFAGVGFDAAGVVKELWIDGPKAGSGEQAALHDASAVVSVALQYGAPIAALAAAVDMQDDQPVSALGAAVMLAAALEREMVG
ncbi:MAG: hypothetical protein DCC73_14920 [Proteobacteria bacterium]|nr:MAG: hypothetical protein DCC73_14920 [Pseudomonadota bacterium]